MKSFEQEIKKRLRGRLIYAICGGAIIIAAFIIRAYIPGDTTTADNWAIGVLIGLFAGVEISAIRSIEKYRRVLKNPEALETLHIQETDERNRVIILRTCRAVVRQTLNILGLALIISAFLSQTVFWTIIAAILLIVVLYYALFAYYSRKY